MIEASSSASQSKAGGRNLLDEVSNVAKKYT